MAFREFNFIKESYLGDIASPTVTYHGFYVPSNTGVAVSTSVAQFLIAKETKDVNGNTTSMKYSGRSYDQIWDNRASIYYD
jgi:hypothetical protein